MENMNFRALEYFYSVTYNRNKEFQQEKFVLSFNSVLENISVLWSHFRLNAVSRPNATEIGHYRKESCKISTQILKISIRRTFTRIRIQLVKFQSQNENVNDHVLK